MRSENFFSEASALAAMYCLKETTVSLTLAKDFEGIVIDYIQRRFGQDAKQDAAE